MLDLPPQDKPTEFSRVLLVHPTFKRRRGRSAKRDLIESNLDESVELIRATGVELAGQINAPLSAIDPSHFIGSGKLVEVTELAQELCVDTVIVDQPLSPGQERNLQRSLNLAVVDRIGLILDIFAQRARSYEGKLQVELAQLRHLSTRLVRGWTHLERQKGGIGLRGPGESQLETDRRLVRDRIALLRRRLDKVGQQRQQNRNRRARTELPTVSLAGYTNSGKSTLFNRLTGGGVFAADQLFATLDPTLRKVEIADCEPLVLADTVGFVRDLPHELIEAFHSTLEEVSEASLVLHVIDSSHEEYREQQEQVDGVLSQIGADQVPQLLVYNKVDLTGRAAELERDGDGRVKAVWVSAQQGDGIELLQQAISELMTGDWRRYELALPPAAGAMRAKIYELGRILNESYAENGDWRVEFEMASADYQRMVSGEEGHVGVGLEV